MGEGAGLSSRPRSTSGHPHTEAAGVLDGGALGEGVQAWALLLMDTSP